MVACALVAGLFAFFAAGGGQLLTWHAARDHVLAWNDAVAARPVVTFLGFAALFALLTALSVPVVVVFSLAAGTLFGVAGGTVALVLGGTVGCAIAFLASRFLFRDWARTKLGERLDVLGRGGALTLFLLRLTPFVPFWIVNLGLGLTPLPLRTFTWVSALGMVPLKFAYASLGAALGETAVLGTVFTPTLWLALGAAALAAVLAFVLHKPPPPLTRS